MDNSTIPFLLLGAAAGGFINGLAGFGTALFALGFFLTIMPPVQAVAIVVVMSVLSGLQGVWIVRHVVFENPVRLLRFLIPALIGIPIGVTTLSHIDSASLKILIAVFLIAYGGYFSIRSNLPQIAQRTSLIDSCVGFTGGVLGGMASLSGALPTIWCSMKTWTKRETRAVLQPYNVAVLMLTAIMLAWQGAYTWRTLSYLFIILPVTMIFAQIGIMIFKRLTDNQFKRMLIVMTFMAGIVLLVRELL